MFWTLTLLFNQPSQIVTQMLNVAEKLSAPTCFTLEMQTNSLQRSACQRATTRALLLSLYNHHLVNGTNLPVYKGLWVKIAKLAYWLAYCKMHLDAVGHPSIFAMLHSTSCVLGHADTGTLSMVVLVLGRTNGLLSQNWVDVQMDTHWQLAVS